MAHPTVQQWLPLLSAGIWLSLTAYQLIRDRFRTWTEIFFIATTFFFGIYALADVVFFNTPTGDLGWAKRAALASFSAITLAAQFFMLFGAVFLTRMRMALLLTMVPTLLLLPWLWTSLVRGMISLHADGSAPYVGEWDDTVYLVWSAYILAYMGVGAFAFWKTYREVTQLTARLRWRMRGIVLAMVIGLVLGASTNMIRGLTNTPILPLFSTASAIPGVVAWIALSPSSKERLSTAVRIWKARHYDIKAAFLTFEDGTLIGSKVKPGEKIVDRDLFGATLDVIQNFMRTSFPGMRGTWLKSISHGDYVLVIERARRAYLTLVLTGRETDQLRRQMRDLLLLYESQNREALASWRGLPDDAVGTDDFLESFFAEGAVEDAPAPNASVAGTEPTPSFAEPKR